MRRRAGRASLTTMISLAGSSMRVMLKETLNEWSAMGADLEAVTFRNTGALSPGLTTR